MSLKIDRGFGQVKLSNNLPLPYGMGELDQEQSHTDHEELYEKYGISDLKDGKEVILQVDDTKTYSAIYGYCKRQGIKTQKRGNILRVWRE